MTSSLDIAKTTEASLTPHHAKREIGILIPGSFFDSLAAPIGGEDTQAADMQSSLRRLNGRPVFSWIAQSFLKTCSADTAKLYVLCEHRDKALSGFIAQHFPKALIECITNGSVEEQLIRVLKEESGQTESVTLLRNNAFMLNPVIRTSNIRAFFDDKMVMWHAQRCGDLLSSIYNGASLKAALVRFRNTHAFDFVSLTSKNTLIFDKNANWQDAKTRLIESRSFNSLKIHPLFPEIVKSSNDKQKLKNEVFWYRELPKQFKALAPQVFGYDDNGIRMEYYGYGTLTEKFLYDQLPMDEWEAILTRLFRIVHLFSKHRFNHDQHVFQIFYCNKFENRCKKALKIPEIGELFTLQKIRINGKQFQGIPLLMPFIYKKLQEIVASATGTLCHGDLCFNNILFDRKTGIIKLIDPRGNIEGIPSIMCDPRYDIAKLKHSFCGNYDGIVEGEFYICEKEKGTFDFVTSQASSAPEREALFRKLCFEFGFDTETIDLIEAYLFLTMIPLHTDSIRKMKAFFLTSIIKFNKYLFF